MARALRFEFAHARYHVTARGNERKAIFRDDSDHFHFLELLGEATERHALQVHASVLMDNHFHLLVETPEANLSRAMQWLGVSYSVWFNRRHDRAGHLFQGRFKGVVVQDDAGWQEVARYVHLNPVRVARLGLNKRQQAASRAGAVSRPPSELIAERLRLLREYRWSSYRGYAGYAAALRWVHSEPLCRLCGGRTEAERRAALREYTEQAVRQGGVEPLWNRLVAGLVLGSESFARKLLSRARCHTREQPQSRALGSRASWEQIVAAVERAKGESWAQFSTRHADWGRDASLWLGRRQGRMSLAELGRAAGGMDYAAVGQALSRFGRRLSTDRALSRRTAEIQNNMSNVET